MKIQWYYIGAMTAMVIVMLGHGYDAGCFVGIGWILAKKALPTKEDQ